MRGKCLGSKLAATWRDLLCPMKYIYAKMTSRCSLISMTITDQPNGGCVKFEWVEETTAWVSRLVVPTDRVPFSYDFPPSMKITPLQLCKFNKFTIPRAFFSVFPHSRCCTGMAFSDRFSPFCFFSLFFPSPHARRYELHVGRLPCRWQIRTSSDRQRVQSGDEAEHQGCEPSRFRIVQVYR